METAALGDVGWDLALAARPVPLAAVCPASLPSLLGEKHPPLLRGLQPRRSRRSHAAALAGPLTPPPWYWAGAWEEINWWECLGLPGAEGGIRTPAVS